MNGIKVECQAVNIKQILYEDYDCKKYPFYIAGKSGSIQFISPSPLHGRSIVVDFIKESNRFIVTKGNGLTYFPFGFISTQELETHAWGFLREEDAVRDYLGCNYVNNLGLLTNRMEAVYLLENLPVRISSEKGLYNPCIVQYSVLSPYRIADIPFLSKHTVMQYVNHWQNLTSEKFIDYHCMAADVLLRNVKTMHLHSVLHNSIHQQNYSLALELLDFEQARTPVSPYKSEKDEGNFRILLKREIIQSLEIVNHVAFYLGERLNLPALRSLMINLGYRDYLSN